MLKWRFFLGFFCFKERFNSTENKIKLFTLIKNDRGRDIYRLPNNCLQSVHCPL